MEDVKRTEIIVFIKPTCKHYLISLPFLPVCSTWWAGGRGTRNLVFSSPYRGVLLGNSQ